ncbi:hypothetical protein NKJ84_32545, partial [Mesorhizobium sp. M0048]|uniref:hypothetical protein n=1 Tax=Mesorhizobium sp. M0048 TaxID=2956860 RepID=UPI00333D4A6E
RLPHLLCGEGYGIAEQIYHSSLPQVALAINLCTTDFQHRSAPIQLQVRINGNGADDPKPMVW